MVAEGIVILYDLASKFIAHKPGYEKPGSFAGYASRYLPKKMFAAWHKLHPEHVLRAQADGTKRYEYGTAPISFDTYVEGDHPGEHRGQEVGLRHVGDFAR